MTIFVEFFTLYDIIILGVNLWAGTGKSSQKNESSASKISQNLKEIAAGVTSSLRGSVKGSFSIGKGGMGLGVKSVSTSQVIAACDSVKLLDVPNKNVSF